MQKKQKNRIPALAAAAAVAAGAFLAVNHRAVSLTVRNLTMPRYSLDESRDDWSGGASYLKVPYSSVSASDYVDIYVPDGVENPPLFVIIHGGGFISGDARNRQSQWMYRYFRDHGYACASVNYRLAQEAPFPAAVEDCKAAIRFLRAHADRYGYNADRIAVFGESAGGYLAAMCAFTNDDEFNSLEFVDQEELGDVSAKVHVLVDYYGAHEWNLRKDLPAIGLPEKIYDIANSWVGPDKTEGFSSVESYWMRREVSEMSPEELAVSSPYTYIDENISPDSDLAVWIVHGDCDITVPYLQSERLNEKLADILGTDRAVYNLVPGMGHASDPLYSEAELEQLEVFLEAHLH